MSNKISNSLDLPVFFTFHVKLFYQTLKTEKGSTTIYGSHHLHFKAKLHYRIGVFCLLAIDRFVNPLSFHVYKLITHPRSAK
jgi:hypothetical protein